MAEKIIARGFDDKPVTLYALEMQPSQRHVNVSGSIPPSSYIGWPVTDAFDYDDSLFPRLKEAYSEGFRDVLRDLYQQLETRPKTFIDKLQLNDGDANERAEE